MEQNLKEPKVIDFEKEMIRLEGLCLITVDQAKIKFGK